jgi:hypothetical protein
MLEILTTDEFAVWFDALQDGEAEEVATALETIEKLGPDRPAPGSSEWLLWYQHRDAPEFVVADDWTSFQDSTKEAILRLGSPAFARILSSLPRDDAGRVMRAIDTIKMASAVRRRGLAMLVAGAVARQGRSVHADASLRKAYQTVASATGFSMGELPAHSSSLRELAVLSPSARLRILYGVDRRRDIALAVLGERLDHDFYGDSVRRAERLWQQFLQSNTEAREPASR